MIITFDRVCLLIITLCTVIALIAGWNLEL